MEGPLLLTQLHRIGRSIAIPGIWAGLGSECSWYLVARWSWEAEEPLRPVRSACRSIGADRVWGRCHIGCRDVPELGALALT